MVLFAVERHPVVPNADDSLDHADAQPAGVERVALLDMRFEIADIALGVDPLALTIGKTGALQSLAQRCAVVATPDPVDFFFGESVGKRAAAEKVAVVALLVRPSGDLDAEPRTAGVHGKGRGRLEPVDPPERAVEPAAIGLGLAVRADQQPPPGRAVAADHITDAVDHRIEPGLAQLVGEPMPRLDIDRRISRAVDAGLVAAELGEPPEVAEDARSVNRRHVEPSSLAGFRYIHLAPPLAVDQRLS